MARVVTLVLLCAAAFGCSGDPVAPSASDEDVSGTEPSADLGDSKPPTDLVGPGTDAGSGSSECTGPGCFLEPCDEPVDCQSGWCIEHLGDSVCSKSCVETRGPTRKY